MSRELDDEAGGRNEPWWGWKPAKAALEYLWWNGTIQVVRRQNFQKVYDLTERVIPGDVLNRGRDGRGTPRLCLFVGAGSPGHRDARGDLPHSGMPCPRTMSGSGSPANPHRLMTIEVEGTGNGRPERALWHGPISRTPLAQLGPSPFDHAVPEPVRSGACATVAVPCACSASTTVSKPSFPKRSGATATTCCRSSRGRSPDRTCLDKVSSIDRRTGGRGPVVGTRCRRGQGSARGARRRTRASLPLSWRHVPQSPLEKVFQPCMIDRVSCLTTSTFRQHSNIPAFACAC